MRRRIMYTSPKTSHTGPKSPLDIWRYFLTSENGRTAKCKICSKIFKTTGGSVIGLYSHLYGVHRNIFNNNIENPGEPSIRMNRNVNKNAAGTSIKINRCDKNRAKPTIKMNRNHKTFVEPAAKINRHVKNSAEISIKMHTDRKNPAEATPSVARQTISILSESIKTAKKRKITDYCRPADTLVTVVARMLALDGASLTLFTESEDLRYLFKCSGCNLPESTNSILNMIIKNADDVKEDTKRAIAYTKTAGHKFTLSLDEWTSERNKRYLNVTLHCKAMNSCKILGPVNITKSISSAAAFASISDYLKTFNVSIQDDIVSLTTDGSSDMRKIGIHFTGHHQWCLAQGVQSAVINTMYRTMPDRQSVQAEDMELDQSTDTSSESDYDSFENSEFIVEKPHVQAELDLHKQVIGKLRKVVKTVKGSHLNASTLQANVRKNHNEDIQLQMDDLRTWTSMVDMIGSFLKQKPRVLALLNNIGSGIIFTEEELECLTEIHLNLDLVRLVVQSLCRKDATLFTADTALRCILIQLEEHNTDLSLKLAANMRKRIQERRLLIAGVLHYLHDLKSFKAFPDDDTTFLKPTNEQITNVIVSLLKQLKFKCVAEDLEKKLIPSCSKKINNATTVLICEQEIELTIKNKGDQSIESTNFDLQGLVSAERYMYENKGGKGVCLTKAWEYLLTVMPTNAHPEKIFTVCGRCECFSTRIINAHPDKMLEALIFLRTYYEEQRRVSRNKESTL